MNYTKIRKTATSNEFKKIYNEMEDKYATELEEKRKKLLESIIICFILFIIALVLSIIVLVKLNLIHKRRWGIIGILFVPMCMYYMHNYKKYNTMYVQDFKDKIIKNFVHHINTNLNYYQQGGKELLNSFLDANFKEKQFNDFSTDDYIEGYNSDGTGIQMCNVSLKNRNDKGELINIVYNGIFSVTKINKQISEEVRIEKNQYLVPNNHEKVEMDSKEFEKYFDVYSTSNILAMEILTHDIMEELLEFYEKYDIEFEIVIKNDSIYIKFNTGVMFEPNILKKSNDINTLWIYYNVLKFVTNFTVKVNKLLKDIEV